MQAGISPWGVLVPGAKDYESKFLLETSSQFDDNEVMSVK